MTSKFVNYYKQNPARNDDPSSPLPIRFPSSSRLLRKKTHQMQKKTRSLKETLTQLIELHKVGPPVEQVNSSILPEKLLNSSNISPDYPNLPPMHTPNDSPIDFVQEYVKNHTHLLESISYLLRLRSGPSAKNQSPVTFETSIEDLVQVLRLSLCSEWAAVRSSALQCFRVLLRTPDSEEETYRHILNYGVDILITRSLDTGILEGGYDMEIVQALRLLYLFVQKHTSEISRPLLAALISIASSANIDNKLFRTCLALIGLLAAKHPQLLQETGGIRTLVQGVLACSDVHMNESLIASVVSLLNHPSTRLVVNLLHELQPLLAPFTDSHYIPHFFESSRKENKTPAELERAHQQAKIQAVNACACAFTSLFHSWSGMFALTQNFDSSSLRGFLEVLPLVTPVQQHAMLDALFRILLIAPPASSRIDQLFDTLPSIGFDRRTRSLTTPFNQGLASLSEDWVNYESERTMPSIRKSRTDLAQCYRVLIMSILFDSKVLVRLLEMSARAPEPIIVKAIILAKEILLTLHKLFPFGLDIAELTDGSITKFLNIEARRTHSSKASKVAVLLQRLYVLDRDSSEDKYSRFLLLLAKPPKLNVSANLDTNKTEESGIHQCIEDISESITQAGSNDNFASWNWAKINSLLITGPTTAIVQKLTDTQIIKKILQVYLPSSQLFCNLPLKDEFDYYVEAGINLIAFLLSSGRVTQLFPLLHEILDNLRLFLDEEKNKKLLWKEQSMAGSLTQAYFLFIGHIAHLEWKVLSELGYPELLLQLFSVRPPNKTLVKLILPTLVFYGSTASQSFALLQLVALSNECQDTRVFCVKFSRTLLRCQKSNFSSQGIRLLVLLVYDQSSLVREEAIKVLDEACEIKKHLVTFSSLNPQISHLSLSGYLLFTRLFSITDNYSLFKSTGVLYNEVRKWIQVKNVEYVELVERSIAEGFTNYVYTEPGQFKRRSTDSETDLTKKQVFVPIHFFGQLAAHYEGCNYIKTESLMDSMIDTVKQQRLDDSADILKMKAAVWALGHIGSQKYGIELLIEENLIDDIVDMCSNSPVLTIRGSCFYSICLMAKTPVGTEALYKLGWVSVRHGNESKWPLAHDSLRDISNMLDQDSLRDDISYGGGKSIGSNRSMLNTSLTLPEKYEFTFSSSTSQETDISFIRSTSPEPGPNSLDGVVPHEPQKVQSFQASSINQLSFMRRNSKNLALNPISSHCYIGLAIPVLRDSIIQIRKEPVTYTGIFPAHSSPNEFNMEMKRDTSKIQIVVMDSTGKFRHRTHTGDSAFSSQSGVSGVSSTVSGVHIGISPQKKLSSASPRGLSLKDQQGTSSTSDHSSSAAVTTDNLLEAVSQLSSNLSLDIKRNLLLKIKANQPNLFTDLQIYLQVVAVLSNYRFSMENRKFIQALFEQSVFDSLFPDNPAIGNGEIASSADFVSKSLTPDLLPIPTQATLKVCDAHVEELQARRRCSTGDAVKLKSMIKKNINDENIENRENLKINITTKVSENTQQTGKD